VYSDNLPQNDSYFQNNLYSRSASVGTNNQNTFKDRYALLSAETSKPGSFCSISDGEIACFKTNTYPTSAGNDCLYIWSPLGSGSTRIDAFVPFFSTSNINTTGLVNSKNYFCSCYLGGSDAVTRHIFQMGNPFSRFTLKFLSSKVSNTFPSNYLQFGFVSSGVVGNDVTNFETIKNISGKTLLLDVRLHYLVNGAYYFRSDIVRNITNAFTVDFVEAFNEVTSPIIPSETPITRVNNNAIIRLESNNTLVFGGAMLYNGNSNSINQALQACTLKIYLISEL